MPDRSALLGHRAYWLCQLGGWGAFFALRLFAVASSDSLTPRDAWFHVISMLAGLAASHLYRALIHRRGWRQLDWFRLLPRVLAASALFSALMTLALWPLLGALEPPAAPDEAARNSALLISFLNGALLFIFWSALYFGWHGYRGAQRARLEQLRLFSAVKEAELRALKSQINPHFLFNALNTVRALIDEDPPRAREAVTQLANLLRASLQAGQAETVPLAQELQTVSCYLAIEQLRHDERLRVRAEIAPETLSVPVPPMLLQTLIENAVKYGVSNRPEGGTVVYRAAREGDALTLRVSNPGRIAASSRSSTGLGLRNATERLSLLYGAQARLELLQAAEDEVCAEARLPLAPGAKPPLRPENVEAPTLPSAKAAPTPA